MMKLGGAFRMKAVTNTQMKVRFQDRLQIKGSDITCGNNSKVTDSTDSPAMLPKKLQVGQSADVTINLDRTVQVSCGENTVGIFMLSPGSSIKVRYLESETLKGTDVFCDPLPPSH